MDYLFIGLGGAFGALFRFGLTKWAGRRWTGDFPLATFGINVSGSFMLGFLYVWLSGFMPGSLQTQGFLTTGFLGAYTTYSTFSLETITLARNGNVHTAVRYMIFSVLAGVPAAYAGILAAGKF